MMKPKIAILLLAAGTLAACGRQPSPPPAANVTDPANDSESAPATPPAVSGSEPTAALPRESLPEPNGPIDPRSAEGAGQVVQHYGALIEQGRWTESWRLWTDRDAARAFDRNWRDDSEVHMEIGKPGDPEGAAGSIYVTVPATFYGRHKSGGDFRRSADVILRRVNDVPGSSEEQRRWHIARIEVKAA